MESIKTAGRERNNAYANFKSYSANRMIPASRGDFVFLRQEEKTKPASRCLRFPVGLLNELPGNLFIGAPVEKHVSNPLIHPRPGHASRLPLLAGAVLGQFDQPMREPCRDRFIGAPTLFSTLTTTPSCTTVVRGMYFGLAPRLNHGRVPQNKLRLGQGFLDSRGSFARDRGFLLI